MALNWASMGATLKTPVTLRFDDCRSGTIFAATGAATIVNTTGMSRMYCGSALSCLPTTPSVTEVPHVYTRSGRTLRISARNPGMRALSRARSLKVISTGIWRARK